MLRAFGLVLLTWSAPAWSKPKKKATPPPAAAQVELKKVLDGAQDKVGACVVEGAGSPAWTQKVVVKVTLNGMGQVMALSAVLAPATPKAATTQACIEAVLRAANFPATHAPLVSVEREWIFTMQ